MKKGLSIFVVVVAAVVCTLSANAQTYYVACDFNSWSATGNVMTQITAGVWQASLIGLSVGYHEFKITNGSFTTVNDHQRLATLQLLAVYCFERECYGHFQFQYRFRRLVWGVWAHWGER